MINTEIITSLSDFVWDNFRSIKTIASAAQKTITPWPASPNMTENRNGKVTMANGADNRIHITLLCNCITYKNMKYLNYSETFQMKKNTKIA